MRRQNIVFHDLLKLVPWWQLDALIEEFGTDTDARKLTTKKHLVAMLYAQLFGSVSLRAIESGLKSDEPRLYHLGGAAVKRSTLADANRQRSPEVFSGLLAAVMAQAHRGLRKQMRESLYLIDATVLPLNSLSAKWARFAKNVHGAKAHMVYDPDADCPVYLSITARSVNDIIAARAMQITAGATYVFDLGYYDFAWWNTLDEAGCRIVTRFKSHTPLDVIETREIAGVGPILSDRIGYLPKRQANSRKNPFQKPVREITVRIETGKVLRILTNDLIASAQEIADLYKQRWAIELFFRWVKQNLRIRKFLGTSENAVRIQVIVALIAFLLLKLAYAAIKPAYGFLEFTRLVQGNLMQRRRIDHLLPHPDDPQHLPTAQMRLQWT
ncbi:MAG: IS4 family transposase [Rhodospirillaceae bacterium]|nr:IS4 family transposase [Rhodospirillaceae bacterium]